MANKHFTDPEELEKYLATQDFDYPEIAETIPPAMLREERNRLLLETDWWILKGDPSGDQLAYRQELRDLPATATPELDSDGQLTGVTWPTKPE